MAPQRPDVCGFYFFPYDLLEELDAKFGGFFVNDLEVEWADEAFAANARQGADDEQYELVREDTYTQKAPIFSGPFPNLGRPLD